MPIQKSINYLIKYRNGDLVLLTDWLNDYTKPVTYEYTQWDDERFSPARITLTDMMDIIQNARETEGTNIYVFEEWS